jgi:cell division protein FtsB
MDEQYYRKTKTTSILQKMLQGVWKNRAIRYTLLFVFPVAMFMLFGNKGILQRLRLEDQKKEMVENIHNAQREQLQLQQQSKALDGDPKAIEKVAREKYGMVRDGETVYKIRKEK